MQGDSIEQAQEAMHELILRLTEPDMISYSKFGSKVIHSLQHNSKNAHRATSRTCWPKPFTTPLPTWAVLN
jgi:hypothetical protein